MSRVGKKPIPVPEKVSLEYKDRVLTVKGEKGNLSRPINENVDLEIGDGQVLVNIVTSHKNARAFQGLTRSLVANMIQGVEKGFERILEINGIGYRAEVKGEAIVFNLGYSHPIDFPLPKGIVASVDRNTVKISGIDKEVLGLTASKIRGLRPPEPYKGKGIKYKEETIQRKAGKTGTK